MTVIKVMCITLKSAHSASVWNRCSMATHPCTLLHVQDIVMLLNCYPGEAPADAVPTMYVQIASQTQILGVTCVFVLVEHLLQLKNNHKNAKTDLAHIYPNPFMIDERSRDTVALLNVTPSHCSCVCVCTNIARPNTRVHCCTLWTQ